MADNSVEAPGGTTVKPWVVIVPVVLIALIFLPSAVVVGVGMVPTVVARVVDTSPGKRLSITVGSFNLIGCLYFLHVIWAAGQGMEDIAPTLKNSVGWLSALVGAGVGWVVFGSMAGIVGKIAGAQTALRMRNITKEQERLVEEWGETVRGAYAVHELAKKDDGEA